MRKRSFDYSFVDPFARTVMALRRRNELGADTDEVLEGLSDVDRYLVLKAAEVLAHFGDSVPEYEEPKPVSGEINS